MWVSRGQRHAPLRLTPVTDRLWSGLLDLVDIVGGEEEDDEG